MPGERLFLSEHEDQELKRLGAGAGVCRQDLVSLSDASDDFGITAAACQYRVFIEAAQPTERRARFGFESDKLYFRAYILDFYRVDFRVRRRVSGGEKARIDGACSV